MKIKLNGQLEDGDFSGECVMQHNAGTSTNNLHLAEPLEEILHNLATILENSSQVQITYIISPDSVKKAEEFFTADKANTTVKN